MIIRLVLACDVEILNNVQATILVQHGDPTSWWMLIPIAVQVSGIETLEKEISSCASAQVAHLLGQPTIVGSSGVVPALS